MDPEIRIGDAERDEAVRRLQMHVSEGRLSLEEFDNRVGRAIEAVTAGDLVELFKDLPGAPFDPPADEPRVPAPAPTYGPVQAVPVRYERPWHESSWVLVPILASMLILRGMGRFLVPLLIAASLWVWLIAPALREYRNPTSGRKAFHYREGDVHGELVALIKANRPIEAVRRHREEYGTDLVTAKQEIDKLARKELGHGQ